MNGSPKAAVVREGSVVAHHEVVARWDDHRRREAARIVAAATRDVTVLLPRAVADHVSAADGNPIARRADDSLDQCHLGLTACRGAAHPRPAQSPLAPRRTPARRSRHHAADETRRCRPRPAFLCGSHRNADDRPAKSRTHTSSRSLDSPREAYSSRHSRQRRRPAPTASATYVRRGLADIACAGCRRTRRRCVGRRWRESVSCTADRPTEGCAGPDSYTGSVCAVRWSCGSAATRKRRSSAPL